MVYIGADMGGSKTDLLSVDGAATHSWSGPGVNVVVVGPERAAETLAALLPRPLPDAVRLCVGAAGAGSEQAATAFRRALAHATSLPQEHILVVTDAEIALRGAFGGASGAVVIAGTGSGCYAFDESGILRRTGGWGPVIGDPASGHVIGKDAVRAALEDLERGGRSPVTRAVLRTIENLSHGGAPPLTDPDGLADTRKREVGASASGHPQGRLMANLIRIAGGEGFNLASLAPTILDLAESGDEAAASIITRECAELARQCARLFQESEGPPIRRRVALMGGLTSHEGFRRALEVAILSRLPDCAVVKPLSPPAHGAIQYARGMT